MNILNKLLLSVGILACAGTISSAQAAVITDSVALDNISITTSSPYTYIHNIFEDGFVPGTQLMAGGTVTIHLTDNSGAEDYLVSIGLGDQLFSGNNVNSGAGNFPQITLLATSLADLQADGMLSVTVSATNGSFFLSGSQLSVTTAPPAAPSNVPEPFTMALLGIGLAGIGIARRKASKDSDSN